MSDLLPDTKTNNNENQVVSKPIDREELFMRYLGTEKTLYEAGIKAGYSPSYAKADLCRKLKSERFLKRLRQHYNGYAAALLPRIMNAELKVVELVNEDPEKLPKFSRTLKELKQSAGVLRQDDIPHRPMVQIGSVQNMLMQVHTEESRKIEGAK